MPPFATASGLRRLASELTNIRSDMQSLLNQEWRFDLRSAFPPA